MSKNNFVDLDDLFSSRTAQYTVPELHAMRVVGFMQRLELCGKIKRMKVKNFTKAAAAPTLKRKPYDWRTHRHTYSTEL